MSPAPYANVPFAAIRHRRVTPIVVIPSRMASARLPGKPLAPIAGRPMVLHVLDRAREAGIGPAAVACADEAILAPLTTTERATLQALLGKITADLPPPTRS